jgi:lipopolysaccharide export system protein LptA
MAELAIPDYGSPSRARILLCLAMAFAASGALFAPAALAERADRDKPISLAADRMTIDDLKHVQVYEGKVVLLQGTLAIHADKIVVTQDADGFRHGIATVAPGNLAYFREKRDGVDEYVEGWGERIEYDDRTDRAELFVRARLKRNFDEVRGSYISYDGKTEYYLVKSGADAERADNPREQVHATIQPKKKEPAAPNKAEPGTPDKSGTATPVAPGTPSRTEPTRGDLSLKSSAAIANPRED